MDPNATLNLIRDALTAANRFEELALEAYQEALEHLEALDEWLSKGGFPPTGWEATLAQLRERLGR